MVKDNSKINGKGEPTMSIPVTKNENPDKDKRPCSPAQSLSKSLKEMNLISQSKLKKRTWNELKNELRTPE